MKSLTDGSTVDMGQERGKMSYLVSVVMPFGGIVKEAYEKDPEKAILRWCRYSRKYPTCVSIQPEAQEGGKILLRWASDNIEKVREYLTENKSPYRIDWMIEEIQQQARDGRTSMQWDGDQLHPFSVG